MNLIEIERSSVVVLSVVSNLQQNVRESKVTIDANIISSTKQLSIVRQNGQPIPAKYLKAIPLTGTALKKLLKMYFIESVFLLL